VNRRSIAAVCRNQAPDSALEPIENIVPIGPGRLADDLDNDLEELLGWPEHLAAEYLSPVVPAAMLDAFLASQSLVIRIGSVPIQADHLELEDFLRRTRYQREGKRLAALRSGHVHLSQTRTPRPPILETGSGSGCREVAARPLC
jgi:hypothetical protein